MVAVKLVLAEWFKSLFSFDGWIAQFSSNEDPRVPMVLVEWGDQEYGFYCFSIQAIFELIVVLSATVAAMYSLGFVINHTIVQKRYGSRIATVMAYGVILPVLVLVPPHLLDMAGIANSALRFIVGSIITPGMFKIIEALYGFTPTYAVKSPGWFAYYYSFPCLLKYNSKTESFVTIKKGDLMRQWNRFLLITVLSGLYYSLFHVATDVFPPLGIHPDLGLDPEWRSWRSVLDVGRWKNNFIYVVLSQLLLARLGAGSAIIIGLISGHETYPIMENPLFTATSPADFWGRRWNLVVHSLLKQSVFKPVMLLSQSKTLAVVATFVVSGLYHEYLLFFMSPNFPHLYGGSTLFFAWMAVLVAVERLIGHWTIFQYICKYLPHPIRTMMVILLALPVGHFFLDTWVRSPLQDQLSIGLFVVRPTVGSTTT